MRFDCREAGALQAVPPGYTLIGCSQSPPGHLLPSLSDLYHCRLLSCTGWLTPLLWSEFPVLVSGSDPRWATGVVPGSIWVAFWLEPVGPSGLAPCRLRWFCAISPGSLAGRGGGRVLLAAGSSSGSSALMFPARFLVFRPFFNVWPPTSTPIRDQPSGHGAAIVQVTARPLGLKCKVSQAGPCHRHASNAMQ